MDKKMAGVVGAVAGLATIGSGQAATAAPQRSDALQASSYADLLAPISNAAELLKAEDAARVEEQSGDVKLVQYYPHPYPPPYYYPYYHHHHHHHHHHHSYYRYYHHHHHHHHHNAFIGIPGVGGVVIPER